MPGLLDTAVTGLQATQNALRTVGHNIANANTAGYSRQVVEQETRLPSGSGAGFIGNGVEVTAVERVVNEYVVEQLRTDTSLSSELTAYNENIRQLDTLLSDPATGLSQAMERFFSTMQNAVDDPSSVPARQLVLSESDNLVSRFNSLYDRLESLNNGINSKMDVAITQVNALSRNIAELNDAISLSFSAGNGTPNDLLDQRDEALRALSELVNIQVVDQGDGQVNVAIGSGQSLVVGNDVRQLALQEGGFNAAESDIVFLDNSGAQVITPFIGGGELGGLLNFRDDVLTGSYNELGRVSMVMADAFNTLHQQGIDTNNDFGGLFFRDVNEPSLATGRAFGSGNNLQPNDGVLSVELIDGSQLTTSDYSLEISPVNQSFTITRESDGVAVAVGAVQNQLPFNVEFDGLRVTFQNGSFQSGDEFLIQPTRTAARDMAVAVSRTDKIALASPVLADSSLSNTGNAQINESRLLSTTDINGNTLPLFSSGAINTPMIVVFTTPTTYDILDNTDPANPVQLDPPIRNQTFVPGVTNQLFTEDMGETRIAASGTDLGMPAGYIPVQQASLQLATLPDPSYSGAFINFTVDINNTVGGANDGTFAISVNTATVTDTTTMLADINDDLAGSDVTAYLNENGNLAFALNTPGAGDITLTVPADIDNTLLGFNVAGEVLTTVANVDGTSGVGVVQNNYSSETVTVTSNSAGGVSSFQTITIPQNASAKEIAAQLTALQGVSATASNYMEISNLALTRNSPLQVNLNGADLLEYGVDPVTGNPQLHSRVPDPTDPAAFNDYLAERINNNAALSGLGIRALSATDATTGLRELRIYSTQGDDLVVGLEAGPGETLAVGDGTNPTATLTGTGTGAESIGVVGGSFDVTLADTYSLTTSVPVSGVFGDTTASNFAASSYFGLQVSLDGFAEAGDTFTVGFNTDGVSDNRNGLRLIDLELARIVDGDQSSLSDSYGKLVELVGIETNASDINTEASVQVLEQTVALRNSISGVNLDEEAADLIKLEQIYNANSQVISIARDLFDRLLNSF